MITNEGKRSHGHWKHYQWRVWMVWRIWGRRTNLREVSRPFDTRRPRHPITSCLIVYQHPSNTQNWRIHKKIQRLLFWLTQRVHIISLIENWQHLWIDLITLYQTFKSWLWMGIPSRAKVSVLALNSPWVIIFWTLHCIHFSRHMHGIRCTNGSNN